MIRVERSVIRRAARCAIIAIAILAASPSSAAEVKVTLSGDQEIPPVTTSATGTGTFSVAPDGTASGGITVSGLKVTVAHIHDAPAGKNGPIVIPLNRVSDTSWVVPPGTKLGEAQLASYRQGNLYFNVHTDAYKGGEIRGQIRP